MSTVETLCNLREIMSLMSFNWIFKESDEEKEEIYDDKLTKEIGREACFGRREDKYFLWAEFVLNIVKQQLLFYLLPNQKNFKTIKIIFWSPWNTIISWDM